MEKRVYNFSPGPAVLPLPALEEAQRDLLALPGTGESILEISHRSKAFDKIITQAEANIRTLLAVPDNYRVLFMQGGAVLQFGMIPMNFLRSTGKPADYIVNGTWSKKAFDEAKTQGNARAIWDGKATNYNRVPKQAELKIDPNAAYIYMTSNETIQGVQYQSEPDVGDLPLVCDSSSDILSRPVPCPKIRPDFRLCPEKPGAGWRNAGYYSRRSGGQIAGRPAFAIKLQSICRRKIAPQHPAHVRHLYGKTRHRLVVEHSRRIGQNSPNKQTKSQTALRRRRWVQWLLRASRRTRLPFRDERALQAGQNRVGRTLPQASGGAGIVRIERSPLSGRLPCVDLQRHARRRRQSPPRLYARFRQKERVKR